MKRFLIRGLIVLVMALILVVVIFGFIQYQFFLKDQADTPEVTENRLDVEVVEDGSEGETVDSGVPAEGIPLNSLPVSEGQRKALETVGVDTETFTITPEMATCARQILGEERYSEILSGATPGVAESLSLLKCVP